MTSAVSALVDLFFPSGCLSCGTWVPSREQSSLLLCASCRTRLPRAPWPRCPRCDRPRGTGRAPEADCRDCRSWPAALSSARHAFLLEPPADALVHALKYEGWPELAAGMGSAMAELAEPPVEPGIPTIVVAVPTTSARVRARGYNQAELLARRFAAVLALPVCEALRRTRGGATQVALHPSERRANVQNVFALRPEAPKRLLDSHVILVDDVLTTGATAGAAATVLAGAGASRVTLVTFARALPFLGLRGAKPQ